MMLAVHARGVPGTSATQLFFECQTVTAPDERGELKQSPSQSKDVS